MIKINYKSIINRLTQTILNNTKTIFHTQMTLIQSKSIFNRSKLTIIHIITTLINQ